MKASFKLRKEAGHGGCIPRGWRMAWYEPRRRVGVYYPAPLHRVMRAAREFVYRIHVAACAPTIERAQVFEMQRAHADRYAARPEVFFLRIERICCAQLQN